MPDHGLKARSVACERICSGDDLRTSEPYPPRPQTRDFFTSHGSTLTQHRDFIDFRCDRRSRTILGRRQPRILQAHDYSSIEGKPLTVWKCINHWYTPTESRRTPMKSI